MLRHEGSNGEESDCELAQNTGSGGTGRELAEEGLEAQLLWPTRWSLKEVADEAGCSLEAD
jgi:hypothetical protein